MPCKFGGRRQGNVGQSKHRQIQGAVPGADHPAGPEAFPKHRRGRALMKPRREEIDLPSGDADGQGTRLEIVRASLRRFLILTDG